MDKKPSLESVVARLRELLPELREHYRVRDIGLFGSYVHGGEHPQDLDTLVTYDEAPSPLRFLELENLLSDRLGVTVDSLCAMP